jgi:hypothetical protein
MKEMRTQDPELYQGLLEVVDKFRARDKTGLIKYMKKYLPHMDDAEIEDLITASDTGDIYGQLIRLGSGRDYKGKIDMIKKFEQQDLLRSLDVEKATKHADGGRVPLAGGGLTAALKIIMQKYGKDAIKLLKDVKPSKKWDTQKAIQEFKKRNPQFKAKGGLAGMLGE